MTNPDDTVQVWLGPGFGGEDQPLGFRKPRAVLSCDQPDQVDAVLDQLLSATRAGFWAVGFFSYELGYLLEARLQPMMPPERTQPLLWFALFDGPTSVPTAETGPDAWTLTGLAAGWDEAAYAARFARVHDWLRAGDAYQINLTFKLHFRIAGDRTALFRALLGQQPAAYAAHLAAPAFDVLSLSPELFFRLDGPSIQTRPMKGTARRHTDRAADDAAAAWLQADGKSRAENLMIVDLLRNDLGRISEIGSVRVDDLFTVERLPTVLQMSSGIRARVRAGTDLAALLRALFPCGSVTGAPKLRAMEIIHALETEPRGVYTGAVGVVAPGGRACFNVAIRTLFVHRDGRGEMGIGSGLVFESEAGAEYAECLLKAKFLRDALPAFDLLETLLWEPTQGYVLRDRHLGRLTASARHFGIPVDADALRRALDDPVPTFGIERQRVRLLVSQDGTWTVSAAPLPAETTDPSGVLRAVLSDRRVHSGDPFLLHKTTRRALYDGEHARLSALTGCDEVLFVNERGALCEGSRTTLFLERDGRLLTPPLSSGLLPGTLRAHLLETRPAGSILETVLTPDDLRVPGTRLLLGNSVRGLRPAVLIDYPKA